MDPSKDTWLHRHYEDFSELPNEIITPMAAVLQENHITIPPEVAPDNLIEWLKNKGIISTGRYGSWRFCGM